tara:strand:+ start:2131 stop:2709 length:579 start_codon:yes stop_codon:yes gene_type:complete
MGIEQPTEADFREEPAKSKVEDFENPADRIPDGFREPQGFQAKKVDERRKKSKKKNEPFEVDYKQYLKFVDTTTSKESKDFDTLIERYEALKESGCDIERLDTAASGLVAEGGEFMEIVKKLKFQGKPWNEDNKEHLIIELGDVMWYVANACIALGVDLDEVCFRNTVKLATRYPEGEFTVVRSENRKKGDR